MFSELEPNLPPLSITGARWDLKAVDPALIQHLSRTLGIAPVVARCMALRGIRQPEEGARMLEPRPEALHDPYAMRGMDRAVDRLRRAARDGEAVRVVTDYDVDGTTSSLILQAALKLIGLEGLSYHIPDRFEEGYGFSTAAADAAAEDGVGLILTADIGVRDHAAVDRAAERGVDVIICDHHLPPGEDVPERAYAVLCPPQARCSYPNPALAACGVSLKLAQALLDGRPFYERILASLLKLAAIGTVADVVDLMSPENRAIVALGLQSLNRGPHAPGLAALLEVSQLEPGRIDAGDLGYRIGPRINAAGRLTSATRVVELLTTRDPDRAAHLARALDRQNTERRRIQKQLMDEATAQIPRDRAPAFIVAAGPESEGWHRGVVGIAAGRIRDTFYRPTAIISVAGDQARGSVRATPEVHAVRALEAAHDLLIQYGGHPAAAGFSVHPDKIPALRQRLIEAALAQTGGSPPRPSRRVDAALSPADVSWRLMRELGRLGPHGKGNPSPRLQLTGCRVTGLRVLKDKHLRFELRGDRGRVQAIWWRAAEHRGALESGRPADFLGSLEINRWRGRESLQFTVCDARLAPPDQRPVAGPRRARP